MILSGTSIKPWHTGRAITQEIQTLLKNLFNLINYWEYLFSFYSLKIFQKPLVKSTLRYQKINFFTTSASLKCIIWINVLSAKESAQILCPAFTMNVSFPKESVDC